MKLSDKIKKYRKENNLTQKELSNKLGIARSTLSDIESERINGSIKFITKLSDYTKLPVNYWLDETVEKDYKTYEALDILIDTLIDSGHIKEDGKINNNDMELVKSLLEKEIKLKIKRGAN